MYKMSRVTANNIGNNVGKGLYIFVLILHFKPCVCKQIDFITFVPYILVYRIL